MEYRYKLDDRSIAKEIKVARKAAHLTQEALAEKINLSPNSISKLETNLMNFSLQTLVEIANVLDLDINYLLSNRKDEDSKDDYTDILFEGMIASLSAREKMLLIHIVHGLRIYNATESEKEQTDDHSQQKTEHDIQ